MNKYLRVLSLAFVLAFILFGCAARTGSMPDATPVPAAASGSTGGGAGKSESSVNEQSSPSSLKATIVLDQKNAVEKTITAKGARIELQDSRGAGIEVYFPSGSVGSDTGLKAVPILTAPVSQSALLAEGFSITGKDHPSKHVKLQADAVIMFMFSQDPGENAAIVQYGEGGDGYTVIPTEKAKVGEKTVLLAEVDGFSAYGVMKATKQEIQDAADKLEKAGFDWVVEVDQKDNLNIDGTDVTMMLRLKASNFKNWVMGRYTGTAYLTDLGVKQTGTLPAAVAVVMADSNVAFTLEPPSPQLVPLVPSDSDAELSLAPLVPSGDLDAEPSLAPLVPSGDDDYQGSGVFHFKISDLTSDLFPQDFTAEDITDTVDVPFIITIRGPVATIEIRMPEGSVFFSGKSIGYSKDSGAAKTPPNPITPADINGGS